MPTLHAFTGVIQPRPTPRVVATPQSTHDGTTVTPECEEHAPSECACFTLTSIMQCFTAI